MRIELLSVTVSEQGQGSRKYNIADVAYRNLDSNKVEGKKIVSFTYPKVFETLKSSGNGVQLDVTSQKNEKSGYWDWVDVVKAGEGSAAPSAPAARGNPTPRNNYETPEERAQKQVYIVRQSSVSSAIALLKTEKNVPSVEDIITAAKVFEDYVFATKADTADKENFDDFKDDIPY